MRAGDKGQLNILNKKFGHSGRLPTKLSKIKTGKELVHTQERVDGSNPREEEEMMSCAGRLSGREILVVAKRVSSQTRV